jgi:hemerythrin
MAAHWKEFLDTGYPAIDNEHRELVRGLESLVEEVNAAKVARIKSALNAVMGTIARHFSHEEQLMTASGWRDRDRHKEAHDLFLEDARQKAKELTEHGLTPRFRQWSVGRLLEWFRLHIMTHDVSFGHHLSKHALAEQSAVDESKPSL